MKIYKILTCPFLISLFTIASAQDQNEVSVVDNPVRSTFGSSLIIDNQSVMVNQKGTFMFNIQHRFGLISGEFDELFGLYAPSNIRLGLNYSLFDNLSLGVGFTKSFSMVDFNVKYALLKQSESGRTPLSVTYYGNVGIESGKTPTYEFNSTDRYSFFHQVIIARKFSRNFSVQVSPSISHFNMIEETMNNDHYAVSLYGRMRISSTTSVLAGVDQPLTAHTLNNPHPNLGLGIEFTTSSHAFQLFFANYFEILNQRNNVFNVNDYRDGDFLFGFNITRLWNF